MYVHKYRNRSFARSRDCWQTERARDAGTSWNTKPVSTDLVRMLPYWCKAGPHEAYFTTPSVSRYTHVSLRVHSLYVLNATRIIGSPFVSNLDIKSALRFSSVQFHWFLPGMSDKSFIMLVINFRYNIHRYGTRIDQSILLQYDKKIKEAMTNFFSFLFIYFICKCCCANQWGLLYIYKKFEHRRMQTMHARIYKI